MRNPRELAPGTIYICGPTASDENLTEFNAAANKITSLGFNVLNPLEIFKDVNTEGYEHFDYMNHRICFLSMCGYVITLTGWEDCSHANNEVSISHILGKRVVYISEFLNKHGVKS